MAPKFLNRLAHAVNAFTSNTLDNRDQSWGYGETYGNRSGSRRQNISNERSIVASIYNRISIDVASSSIKHVRVDENDQYLETINSGLNECFNLKANIDQGSRNFKQDIVMSLFEKGTIAIVPIDTDLDPKITGSYDISSMRIGEIVAWYPRHVKINIYNDRTGRREDITMGKDLVAIVENPLYAVMNESNSTLQRLIHKLHILDAVDDASGSGKLDLIIQLPYVIKTDVRRAEAEKRAKDIEMQLKGSKYGIAYTDGTEKITQLNRPVENNLLSQIEFLTKMLYAQLGLTESIFDGTANEAAMINYYNRTIEPILAAITESMKSSFLTKTARTQMQSILYLRNPFKFIAFSDVAEIADKLSRNEILSANEIRGLIGFKPSKDPKADKLINSNMPTPEGMAPPL